MSDAAISSERPGPQQPELHFFCLSRVSYIAFLMLLAIAAHAVLAWFLLDPNWKPSGGRAGRGYALVLLLTLLPVALRVPLVLSMAGYLIRVTILRLRHALDDQADFVLGPDGVSGWDGFVFRTIPWSEVSKVVVVDHDDGKALWSKRRRKTLFIHGAEAGPRRFFGTFPPRRVRVFYSEMFFSVPDRYIVQAIARYRPDLVKDLSLD